MQAPQAPPSTQLALRFHLFSGHIFSAMPTKHHSITHSIYRVSFGHTQQSVFSTCVQTWSLSDLHARILAPAGSKNLFEHWSGPRNPPPPIWALSNHLPMPITDLEPSDHKNAQFSRPPDFVSSGEGETWKDTACAQPLKLSPWILWYQILPPPPQWRSAVWVSRQSPFKRLFLKRGELSQTFIWDSDT